MATTHKNPSTVQLLREFSVPLVVGILLALAWANLSPASYHAVFHFRLLGHPALDFLTNDVFMVIFFGIAAVEITMSVAPGGSLNPPSKAVNPLLASAGGIAAPIVVYFVLNRMLGGPALRNGWGIPTATDIALAWLVARLAFGNGHPAISFLLLLAVADDAVGLVIVAVFYPDAALPLRPAFGLLVAAGMGIAYVMRRNKVNDYRPYLLLGGTASWAGLFLAHLHPALALVFIVPFLPHRTYGADESIFDARNSDQSALGRFEHQWKAIVDFGMFMFGLTNAGVNVAEIGAATWLVFLSLLIGKTAGIFLLGSLGQALGFPLPQGVRKKELLVLGMVAGIGLTVSLFIAGEAFVDSRVEGAAKMGALFSAAIAIPAIVMGRMLRQRPQGAQEAPQRPRVLRRTGRPWRQTCPR